MVNKIFLWKTYGDLTENRTPILRMKILCPKPLDDEAVIEKVFWPVHFIKSFIYWLITPLHKYKVLQHFYF